MGSSLRSFRVYKGDPNQAPTEVAPSTHDAVEGETPSILETPHFHPDHGDTSPEADLGLGSDTPVGQGGTLDLETFTIVGATAPPKAFVPPPGVPPPPEYLPEMKDEQIVKNTIKALSPRFVAVHGPGIEVRIDHLCTTQKNTCTAVV